MGREENAGGGGGVRGWGAEMGRWLQWTKKILRMARAPILSFERIAFKVCSYITLTRRLNHLYKRPASWKNLQVCRLSL